MKDRTKCGNWGENQENLVAMRVNSFIVMLSFVIVWESSTILELCLKYLFKGWASTNVLTLPYMIQIGEF
jgi:hypothetical protein